MAAASGDSIPLSEVDRRVLECAICQERYKSPKILNCHHSFCKPCLDEWVKANNGKLRCPSCRTECPLPPGGVSRLRDNTFLNDLIGVIMESGSTTKSTKCESCKETDASHWCKDCAQFYCKGCDVVHETLRLLKGHERMPVKEYSEKKETEHFKLLQPRFCDIHPSSQLEFFCDSCQHPVCLKCTIIKHKPPQHDVISTDEALQKYTPSIKKYADELGTDVAKLKEAKQIMTDDAKSFSQDHRKAKSQIKDAVDEVCRRARAKEAELLQDVDDKYRTHEKQIQALLEDLDLRLGSVDSMHSYLTHVLRYGNAVDILSAKKSPAEIPSYNKSLDIEIQEMTEQHLLFVQSSIPFDLNVGHVVCESKTKKNPFDLDDSEPELELGIRESVDEDEDWGIDGGMSWELDGRHTPVRQSASHDIQPQDPCAIEVTGIKPDTSDDALELYFESKRKSGGGLMKTYERIDEGKAVIVYESPIVAQRVLRKNGHAVNGVTLTVKPLIRTHRAKEDSKTDKEFELEEEPNCTVEVTGFKPETSQDTLELYFESRRSGGGSMVFTQLNNGVFTVIFENPNVCQRVLQKKHVIGGAKLSVKEPSKEVDPEITKLRKTRLSFFDFD